VPAERPAVPLPDPLEVWRACAESVGGLAADFAATAIRAAWQEDVLEIVLPADGTTAASFLRRPEVSAGLKTALAEHAGRPVRHAIVVQAATPLADNGPVVSAAAVGRSPQGFSQAALLREAMEHPLVVHARTVFDAAVRKVEPPRRERHLPVQPAAAGSTHERSNGPDEGAAGDGQGGDDGNGDHQHAGTDQGGLHG
jgi:hypothetical protein